ncbi:transglycosylase domain-containing protein [Pedobacter heparinus]|uniref:Glycosyl transferase family 51 n=1 Tax=Pedobacter heparinus (strain ATCC 13125 / DSM 2366 / CIP 104194 / JCM 7457 / NBRC 12017 / NCIMB 9290 / NRRL B-14731 / HIM 762-3) TaxID=485917 RepID=C6XXL7_PEDHD|nr:biosynthetic peptidoglycan transglycosylase [Pedobacter heparinus]ACU02271.1 glycosyl transferase family 51 [Pedobacter heparinus DSM 2366]
MHLPKINIPKKYIKIGAWVLGGFLLVLVIGGIIAYNKREALLEKMMAKAIAKADKDYGLDIKIGEYGFNGLNTVQMKGISVVPKDRDTLTTINDMTIGVKLFPLIFGDVKLSEINLNSGKVNIVFRDSLSNLDFFLKRKKKDSTENKSKIGLGDLAHNLLNQVLYKIPDNMEVKDFLLNVNDNDTAKLTFLTTTATIDDGDLNSTILVNGNEATWHIKGTVKPGKKQLDVMLFADNKKVELPYLERKLQARFSFDTVRTEMKNADYSGDNFKISGSWSVKNLLINHPKIASNDIIVPDAKIDADMLIGKNFVALDSSSTIFLKNAAIHPYLKYTLSPHKIYELQLHAPDQDAQEVLSAFPKGLFESLEGMQVSGKVRYDLNFYLDSALPDSVQFNSSLTPMNFKILKWGKTNLQKINSDFIYTPYERGKPMRDIMIGPSNPNFTPLSDVSSNFKNAILTSEDPSFFTHKGFVQESIRKSFAVNFKEKKFVRGGSTISMQLVKNVFLSRQKTLARKAEEILIVWLIENNHLVSKNRMLEVYFNIIEMGQNIYGIGEATRYYFGKRPSDLNIGEGIFLANIVPRPKIALFKFRGDGGLKDYLYPYFKYIGNIMARRGLTPADTSGYGFYNVRLREGLRQYLLPDSAKIDTNAFDNDDPLPAVETQDASKNLFDRLFGRNKKDTTTTQPAKLDTAQKTKKELRQERREQRRKEKEKEKTGQL